LFDLMWNVDVSDVVEHVSVPTLAIHFTDDFINVDNAHWITDRIPGAQLAILPGGSHVPADIAGVDLVVDEIERFVTGTVAVREEQRMLATVLFTDIVGSTEHAAALGDVRWRQIVNAHDQIFRDQLAEHRGREIKSTGDGFLAIFPTPARAVRCARAFTAAVADLDISVRAGVHSGEIELVGEDIAGLAVAIAARVSALACAGQVLVTTTVRDLTFGSDLAYEPRGEHLLKGVPGSWTVLEAVAEHQPTAGLLPTSEPAGDITGRLLRQVAFRSPRIARLTTRSVQRLPTPPGPWARKRDLRGRHRRDGRAPDDETGRDR
jgi:class 3 adenylate cyclase